MDRRFASKLATFGFAVVGCLAASPASADSSVMVLGLESRLPDVPVTTTAPVNARLLDALHAVPNVHVSGGVVGQAVASRASACREFGDACLERIAERARIERIVYGEIRALDEEHAVVRLSLFDRFARGTRHSVEGVIELDDLDAHRDLDRLYEKIVPLVTRWPEEGAALVRAMPGSQVFLDGRAMGEVPASGELDLRPLRVGRRMLRVLRPSGAEWLAPVVVPSRELIEVTVDAGGSVAELESVPAGPARTSGIEPPPEWVLTIPGVTEPTEDGVFALGEGVASVHFRIPVIVEHIDRDGFRTTTHARVGWLPNVGSGGARVTAKLRF